MYMNTIDENGYIMPYMGSIEISVEFHEDGTFQTHAPATADGELYIWTTNGYVRKYE